MAGRNTLASGKIAGVVLAGGKSSRMGHDKAALLFHGKSLLDHMIALLQQAGCTDIYVSGDRAGYISIPDPLPHQGPAAAIAHIMQELHSYRGVLFTPVDMPFLSLSALKTLLAHDEGAYFEQSPLPAYLPARHFSTAAAVHDLLKKHNITAVPCPEDWKNGLINLNTPDDWRKFVET